MAVTMPFGGKVYDRAGPRALIILGLFMNVISFYQLSCLALDVGYWELFFPQVVQGIGFGFIFVALNTAVLSTIEKPFMAAASGLYNVIRQVFSSVGIALAATFLVRGEYWYRAVLTEHTTAFSDATSESLHRLSLLLSSQGANASGTDMEALKVLDMTVVRQADMLAYNHVFFLIAAIFLFSLPLVPFIKHKMRETGEKVVAE